jgi:hypothetical protein
MAQLALKRTMLGGLSSRRSARYKTLGASLVKKPQQRQTKVFYGCVFDFNYRSLTRAMLWGSCHMRQGIFQGIPSHVNGNPYPLAGTLHCYKGWPYLLEAVAST